MTGSKSQLSGAVLLSRDFAELSDSSTDIQWFRGMQNVSMEAKGFWISEDNKLVDISDKLASNGAIKTLISPCLDFKYLIMPLRLLLSYPISVNKRRMFTLYLCLDSEQNISSLLPAIRQTQADVIFVTEGKNSKILLTEDKPGTVELAKSRRILLELELKILIGIAGVSVTAGTLSMTALSLDRYISVRHPQIFLKISRRRLASILIVMVWTIALLFSLPIIFVRKIKTLEVPTLQVSFCIEHWSPRLKHIFTIATLINVYALPCVILLICQASISRTIKSAEDSFLNRNNIRQRTFRIMSHHQNAPPPTRENTESYVGRYSEEFYIWKVQSRLQNICVTDGTSSANESCSLQSTDQRNIIRSYSPRIKRRLAYLLMGMTLCFVTCWLPYNIISSYVDLFDILIVTKYLPFTLLLGHAHSAINPVVYWLLNKTLRRKMQEIKYRSTTRSASRVQRIPMKRLNSNPQTQFLH
ncbi:5-hydroxytryptamine receptor 1E-like [Tachypleus tridentatus]|uniref:5-hydroxytryptamine receptor 1E-like n=1 Tax=Tachypleus tridentatus TaxID=6853 RepID=UPI003FCF1C48